VRHNRNEFGAPEPGETATAMEDKLRFHTAAWDLSVAARLMPFIAMGSAVTPQRRALAKLSRLGFRTKELLGGSTGGATTVIR